MKEKYEMTFNQYCEDFLNGRYGSKYRENKKLWEQFKETNLKEKWVNILLKRAEEGTIPEIVMRSYVNMFGEARARRIFRGRLEKGIELWEQTQINKVYRENVIDNLIECQNNIKA